MSNRRGQTLPSGVATAPPPPAAGQQPTQQSQHQMHQQRNIGIIPQVSVSTSNNPAAAMFTNHHQFSNTPPPGVQGSQPPAMNAAQRPPYYLNPQPTGRMPQGGSRMMPPTRPGVAGNAGNNSHHAQMPQHYTAVPGGMQYAVPMYHPIMQQARFQTAIPSGQSGYPYQAAAALHGHIPTQGGTFMMSQPYHNANQGFYPGNPPTFMTPPPMQGMPNQMQMGGPAAVQPPPNAAGAVPPQNQTQGQQGQQPLNAGGQPRPQPPQTPPAYPAQQAAVMHPQYFSQYQAQFQQQQQQQPQQPPAAVRQKRAKHALTITNPETGANVLDELKGSKDEAKTEDATKKDDSKPAAASPSTKDEPATVPSSGSTTNVAASDATKMSVRDEFQSKVASKIAAETKADKAPNAAEIKPVIHSELSLSNSNSHSGNEEVKESKEESVEPETPTKSKMDIQGLEPVSPTPLPDTPSVTKDVVASKPTQDDTSVKTTTAPSKKSAASKRAELNSKGAEKATGSEMDVFTGITVAEEADASKEGEEAKAPDAKSTEINQAGSKAEATVASESVLSSSTSSLTSTETLSVVNNGPSKQAIADDVVYNHVKDDVTPATPTSNEDENDTAATPTLNSNPVENGTSGSAAQAALKQLKYSYKEGQWSPINPDGKKQYDREFLYELQRDPKSLLKPQNLPHMDIIKDKAITSKLSSAPSVGADFMPNFVKTLPSRGPGGGGLPKSRSREGGKRIPGTNSGSRSIVLSIQEKNVELRTTENAWKPDKMKSGDVAAPAELDPLQDVSKQVLAILNKLTPQKFSTLLQKFNKIEIDTEKKLSTCIELIFEKAVDEPGFSEEYAKMCRELSLKEVTEDGVKVNFRKLLLGRCQVEFEKDYMEGLNKELFEEKIAKAKTEDERKELQADFEDKERKARRRSAGNTRFIGELYKRQMLSLKIMHECIRRLLSKSPDEESLECLCRLVTTVGKVLEEETERLLKEKPESFTSMDVYFNQMKLIIDQKKTSTRVRCLLMDLLDLRMRKWIPRRTVAGPKTIDQIHKDIEKEKRSQQLESLVYNPSSSKSHSLMGRDSYRDSRNQESRKRSTQRVTEDGWSTQKSRNIPANNDKFDAKVLQSFIKKDPEQVFKLSSQSQFSSSWGKGSGTKAPNQPVAQNNRFDLLNERSVSPSMPGDKPRMASRSVSGMMSSGRGLNTDSGRHEALEAVKKINKLSVPNGPSGGSNPSPSSAAQAVIVSGPTESEISANQERALEGFDFLGEDEKTKQLLERRLGSIIDQYCYTPNVNEAIIEVKLACRSENLAFCVEYWINRVMESKLGSREKLGYLLVSLVKGLLLQRSQVVQGIGNVLEIAEDMICDIPKFWEWIGELIAPLLESRMFAMNILPETAMKINEGKPCESTGLYVEAVLRLLCKKVDQIKVAEMWNEVSLNWTTFLPEDCIEKFVTKHHLEYTLSASSSTPPDPSRMSPNQLREAIIKMMDIAHPYKEVFEFIDTFYKCRSTVTPLDTFIRIVVTAVTRSCLQIKEVDNQDQSQQSIQCKFQGNEFDKKSNILRRLLDGKNDRELQALYAMQALMFELEHPSRMLLEIFEALNSNDLISQESFLEWEKSENPAEQNGKGVAIKSVIQFFTLLKENEDD